MTPSRVVRQSQVIAMPHIRLTGCGSPLLEVDELEVCGLDGLRLDGSAALPFDATTMLAPNGVLPLPVASLSDGRMRSVRAQ